MYNVPKRLQRLDYGTLDPETTLTDLTYESSEIDADGMPVKKTLTAKEQFRSLKQMVKEQSTFPYVAIIGSPRNDTTAQMFAMKLSSGIEDKNRMYWCPIYREPPRFRTGEDSHHHDPLQKATFMVYYNLDLRSLPEQRENLRHYLDRFDGRPSWIVVNGNPKEFADWAGLHANYIFWTDTQPVRRKQML